MFETRLKEAMFRAGLTQIALAKRLGVSERAVAKWQAGTVRPHPERLQQICEALNVSTDWLVGIAATSLPDAVKRASCAVDELEGLALTADPVLRGDVQNAVNAIESIKARLENCS